MQAQTLRTTRGELRWDELIFATGSQATIPPLAGAGLPHVYAFRTFADVEAILTIGGPAVVIGGGVLGVRRPPRCAVPAMRSLYCTAASG